MCVCVMHAYFVRARVCVWRWGVILIQYFRDRETLSDSWVESQKAVCVYPRSPSLSVSLCLSHFHSLSLPPSLSMSLTVCLSLSASSVSFFLGGGVLIHHPIITRFYHTSGRTMSGDILYSLWLSTNVYVCRRCLCGQSLRHKHFRYQQRSHTHPVTCSFIMAALLPAADNTR